jgi:glycosyltransferase involved in cell wall biosynthesis
MDERKNVTSPWSGEGDERGDGPIVPSKEEPLRILIVGDPNSIHTSRFIGLLQELDHDVHIFQSEQYYWQEEQLNNVNIYVSHPEEAPKRNNRLIVTWPAFFEVREAKPFAEAIAAWSKHANAQRPREAELARVIQRIAPDAIFSLKMQNDGYTVAKAKAMLTGEFSAPWIHFAWGTDIEFFGKDPGYSPAHLPRIQNVLEHCDFLITDTSRDALQAADFGFKGQFLGIMPAFGGFDLDLVDEVLATAPPKRDVILVKARQGGYIGKGLNILRAIESMPELFRNYRIVLVVRTVEVVRHLEELDPALGISYETPSHMSYAELLRLFSCARLAISATDVDGSPAFLLEAMAMGALPVHSDMASVREWVKPGSNGLLFPVDDADALTAAIVRGLNDENLFNRAFELNTMIVRERLDRKKVRVTLRDWLKEISLFARRKHGAGSEVSRTG